MNSSEYTSKMQESLILSLGLCSLESSPRIINSRFKASSYFLTFSIKISISVVSYDFVFMIVDVKEFFIYAWTYSYVLFMSM